MLHDCCKVFAKSFHSLYKSLVLCISPLGLRNRNPLLRIALLYSLLPQLVLDRLSWFSRKVLYQFLRITTYRLTELYKSVDFLRWPILFCNLVFGQNFSCLFTKNAFAFSQQENAHLNWSDVPLRQQCLHQLKFVSVKLWRFDNCLVFFLCVFGPRWCLLDFLSLLRLLLCYCFYHFELNLIRINNL